MEVNIGVFGQPLVVFLVRTVVVEDDVNLLIVWNINDRNLGAKTRRRIMAVERHTMEAFAYTCSKRSTQAFA